MDLQMDEIQAAIGERRSVRRLYEEGLDILIPDGMSYEPRI